jgi:aminoglycoside phosphotransferase (APT) family kinase protein
MHPGQLAIYLGSVRELVDAQLPQWRALAIEPVDSAGTVNALFRIGDDLTARLPLEPGDPALVRRDLECEATAARELAGRTRFPTPEPVALGESGAGYPLPWLVQTWLPGITATVEDPGGSAAFARDLAEFISGSAASAQTAGRSAGQAAETTWHPMTPGCKPVSSAAVSPWTFRGFAGCGTFFGNCRTAGAGRDEPR